MSFMDAVVAGIPLILVILALVSFAKSMGLAGKGLTVLSLSLGLVFGVLYQLSVKVPIDFAGWFAVFIYGLTLGLVTSGFYDQVKEWTSGISRNTVEMKGELKEYTNNDPGVFFPPDTIPKG